MTKYNETAVKQRYGKTPSLDLARQYLKALKVIIGADGEIAEGELKALKVGMSRMGASDELKQEILDFDIAGVELDTVLPNLTKGGKKARMLLRDAIELSRADGVYAKEEKAAVAKAARLLGVESHIVKGLEALVELEKSAKHLREALL